MIKSAVESLEFAKAASIKLGRGFIEGELILPPDPTGVVILAHGSGSSKLSPRNRTVARVLRERGFGTLLIDLETLEERCKGEELGHPSIDCLEMASRILSAADWLSNEETVLGLPVGFLGAGTGAAAAITAVSTRPNVAGAIVGRGARTELVAESLPKVRIPTLLIVGAHDLDVVQKNRDAVDLLGASIKQLQVIPGAHHSFEEPGTLAATALHAANWFERHLPPRGAPSPPDVDRPSYAYGGL